VLFVENRANKGIKKRKRVKEILRNFGSFNKFQGIKKYFFNIFFLKNTFTVTDTLTKPSKGIKVGWML